MKEDCYKGLVRELERSPKLPYLFRRSDDALEAYGRLRIERREVKLVCYRTQYYIAVSNEALEYLVEMLERERSLYAEMVEKWESEIAGIRGLMSQEPGSCRTPDNPTGLPVSPEEIQRMERLERNRIQYAKVVEDRESEIAGIRELMSRKAGPCGIYWSRDDICGPQ